MGGFLTLTVRGKEGVNVKAFDVTGLLWLDSKTLVYSTEQAYGDPALWVFRVGDSRPRAVVRNPNDPKNTDSGFELVGACPGPPILYFYYRYSRLAVGKAHRQLYKVNLNGTGFSTADSSASELLPESRSR
jgi:hypothetical protein